MDALQLAGAKRGEPRFLTFSNQDGKRWSIPLRNTKVALELYQPSGTKGKLLKSLLPAACKTPVAGKLLHGQEGTVQLSPQLRQLLGECFGDGWDFSVFWGTPCVDQKVTIQIYRKNCLLGYCKVGQTQRVAELFQKEKAILDELKEAGMPHVPRCLGLRQLDEACWAFVQSTEKQPGAVTEHSFGKRQQDFLEELFQRTKRRCPFEETDYAQALIFLRDNLSALDPEFVPAVGKALESTWERYAGQTVEWGMCHGDFTPWNTCLVGEDLFVFDFEYALCMAPLGLDRWHFFVQTELLENKKDVGQIAQEYSAQCDRADDSLQCYLLWIIALYVMRESKNDNRIAMERAELLKYIMQGESRCV